MSGFFYGSKSNLFYVLQVLCSQGSDNSIGYQRKRKRLNARFTCSFSHNEAGQGFTLFSVWRRSVILTTNQSIPEGLWKPS
jgi:hypothetical protein